LWCLENCWNATCHCCGVWRIAGRHHVIVVVLFFDMIISIQTSCVKQQYELSHKLIPSTHTVKVCTSAVE
jgi:hypothetical protein